MPGYKFAPEVIHEGGIKVTDWPNDDGRLELRRRLRLAETGAWGQLAAEARATLAARRIRGGSPEPKEDEGMLKVDVGMGGVRSHESFGSGQALR